MRARSTLFTSSPTHRTVEPTAALTSHWPGVSPVVVKMPCRESISTAKNIDLALQRGRTWLGLVQHPGYVAGLGGHSGGHNHSLPAPTGDHRVHEDRGRPVC